MDGSENVDAPRPEPQIGTTPVTPPAAVPGPIPDPVVEEPSVAGDPGSEVPPVDERPPGSEIGETFAALLDSAVEFVRTVLDWVEERTRTIVKDKIAKPMAVAIVVAAVGATMMASLVAVIVCLLFGGIVILLAKLVGYGLSALIVGLLGTCVLALVLWRMWVAVMPDEQEE